MDTTRIRPIAICLFRHGDRILVSEGFDSVKQSFFYRPLGGGIEYGETSEAALRREIKEELDAEIENVQFIGALENIFTYQGERGHEIVFVFDAEFVDKSLYELDEIDAYEHGVNTRFKAKWWPLDEVQKNGNRLVPGELAPMLGVE